MLLFLLVSFPTLLFLCTRKSERTEDSKKLLKQSTANKMKKKKGLSQSTSTGTSRTTSSYEKMPKIGSRKEMAKERAEEKKKSVRSKESEMKEDVTQMTELELGTRSTVQKLLATEANTYEKAAFADGTTLDPTKVKRMGGLEDFEDEKKKGEHLKELERMSIIKGGVGMRSEETDANKRVTILTEKCLIYEVPDEPTIDEDAGADEEPDPAII